MSPPRQAPPGLLTPRICEKAKSTIFLKFLSFEIVCHAAIEEKHTGIECRGKGALVRRESALGNYAQESGKDKLNRQKVKLRESSRK